MAVVFVEWHSSGQLQRIYCHPRVFLLLGVVCLFSSSGSHGMTLRRLFVEFSRDSNSCSLRAVGSVFPEKD